MVKKICSERQNKKARKERGRSYNATRLRDRTSHSHGLYMGEHVSMHVIDRERRSGGHKNK